MMMARLSLWVLLALALVVYSVPSPIDTAVPKRRALGEDDHDDHDHDEGGDHDGHDHDEKEEDPCFSGADTVDLESGAKVMLSELKVGDRVLASDAAGQFSFSEVVFLPHGPNDKKATFMEVELESGKHVSATPRHLLMGCDGKLATAASFSAGSCLVTVDGKETVAATRKVTKHGVYTAVTNQEFLVVNGVVASPFAYTHIIPHKYYDIHRAVSRMFPSLLKLPLVEQLNDFMGSAAIAVFTATSLAASTQKA